MIICDRFVFVHLAKTGGKWLRGLMTRYRHPDWGALEDRPDHHPAREAPSERPMLATIRNPWDWYVSLYFYRRQCILNRIDAWGAPEETWDEGRRTWAQIIAMSPNEVTGFRRALLTLTQERVTGSLPYGHEGQGSLTKRYERFLLDSSGQLLCEVIRFENMREEAESFFFRHRIPMRDAFRVALRTAPPANTSKHGPYRDYYDVESRRLVEDTDRALIERYSYEF